VITAIDKNGNKVFAWDVEYGNKGDYICPFCNEPVFVKKGEIKMHHFAHYPRSKCLYKEWEPETNEHISMKKYFYRVLKRVKWVDEVDLERPIGNRIVDVYVRTIDDEEIAIECQASPCSYRKIDEKTNDLIKSGAYVIWVAHNRYANKIRLRPVKVNGLEVVCRFDGRKAYLVDTQGRYRARVSFSKKPIISDGLAIFSPKGDFTDSFGTVYIPPIAKLHRPVIKRPLEEEIANIKKEELEKIRKETQEWKESKYYEEPDDDEDIEDNPEDMSLEWDVETTVEKIKNAKTVRCSKCKNILFKDGIIFSFGMRIESYKWMYIECKCGRRILVRGDVSECARRYT